MSKSSRISVRLTKEDMDYINFIVSVTDETISRYIVRLIRSERAQLTEQGLIKPSSFSRIQVTKKGGMKR